ncbi:hypothetical protein C1Y40_03189 [Mycobacterium talmoniae]|uniref:Uncharacterized protein n=1 Tax=Mycobacterium talmoniae TaxID=1858794 RepID=A0A2S8BIX2_9MYCO|nr:hypothetical protein C1Y40_03189 [Mycobacterium talmoniae]
MVPLAVSAAPAEPADDLDPGTALPAYLAPYRRR